MPTDGGNRTAQVFIQPSFEYCFSSSVSKLQHNDKVTFIAKFLRHLTHILQNYLFTQAVRHPYECNLFIYAYVVFMFKFLRWPLWCKVGHKHKSVTEEGKSQNFHNDFGRLVMSHLPISCTYIVRGDAAVCDSPLMLRVAVSYFGQILTKNQ